MHGILESNMTGPMIILRPSNRWGGVPAVWIPAMLLLFWPGTESLLAGEAGSSVFHWRPFLAPFHSVVLHLPIGFVTILIALELLAMKHPGAELRRATGLVLTLSVWSSVVTIGLGLLRGDAGEYDARTLDQHKLFGIAVGVGLVAAWAVRRLAMQREESRWLMHGYQALLAVNLAVLVVAGHLGGNLTHGSDYLVKHAPGFVKELMEEPSGKGGAPAPGGDIYSNTVKPVFEQKCYSCHGPEKRKGDYRMDDVALLFKGGDSEETAIVPGEPLKSNLVRLILLPEEDDSVMPPSGKGTLTADETMAILRWIRDGAKVPGGSPGAASH